MYSNYGSYRPRFDPIQTYLMLGAYRLGPGWTYFDRPRRRADRHRQGSIAQPARCEDGRLGQVQLLPDEWNILARDGDKDGKVDVRPIARTSSPASARSSGKRIRR